MTKGFNIRNKKNGTSLGSVYWLFLTPGYTGNAHYSVRVSYEKYREENRLTTNNARKIEIITTTKFFGEIIDAKCKILDCAAGTGIYAFWLADKGHDVTATDIIPRHIDIINQTLLNTNYSMNTAILDATDMSIFEDETFDVVIIGKKGIVMLSKSVWLVDRGKKQDHNKGIK